MGGCFSLSRKPDLSGNTFSHYSLTSQSDNLDLYPGFRSLLQSSPSSQPSVNVMICRYAETDTSTLEDSQSVWRRSSVPLLQSWDTTRAGGSDTTSLDTEPGAYCDNQSQVARAPVEGSSARSDGRTLYIWDRTIVRLRNSLKRNKVRGSPGQAGQRPVGKAILWTFGRVYQ